MLFHPRPAADFSPVKTRCAAGLALVFALLATPAFAQDLAQPRLPPEVDAMLARAKVPREALSAVVVDAAPGLNNRSMPLLSFRASQPMNPASVMKLVTTYAGLELLGPSYTWNTPVYLDGTVANGVLQGNLVIQGRGDPKLVMERLWLLMRRVQSLGVKSITGDILLDRSAFAPSQHNAAAFDNDPLKPYNVGPDALLINYKSVVMTFTPNTATGSASVAYDPPMASVQTQPNVALAASPAAECGDYQGGLKADFNDPFRIAFNGVYPAACGEKTWAIAYPDPASYAERAVGGMWQELGGKLGGRVREGRASPGLKPAFEAVSPTLTEVIRDINKYSNNVMTQQVFLTLALQRGGTGSFDGARVVLGQWWRQRMGSATDAPVLDNGAGLSRDGRISAAALARLLQTAWASPLMPELMASLPIAGVDGTLRRVQGRAAGSAHLKTGTLRDVTAMAGYVLGASGRRYVLVAIVNHANAPAARPAIEALADWAAADGQRAD